MDQIKAKFCLSRRVEEYYFEESLDDQNDSQNDSLNDSEYATICKLIHQRALNRTKKLEIKNRLNGYFNQRQINNTNYTSDGDSLYTSSSNSQLSQIQQNSFDPKASLSFKRKKFDLIQNN